MSDAPDFREYDMRWREYVTDRVRAHRQAQAAANPAPVHLCTGRFALPGTTAVWRLPLADGAALEIVWREDGDTVATRFRPAAGEGA